MSHNIYHSGNVELRQAMDLHGRKKFADALRCYEQLIKRNPRSHHLYHLAGQACLALRDIDQSIAYLKLAISLNNAQVGYHNDLGNAYWSQRRLQEAVECFRAALHLDPESKEANFNLGNCHWVNGELDLALERFLRVVYADPKWIRASYLAANCYLGLGLLEDAEMLLSRAVDHPELAVDARLGLAFILLKRGEWETGFKQFESRLDLKSFKLFKSCSKPIWDGSVDPNCRLLVYAEQGIGDLLMFARFLSRVRKLVKKVVLVCDPAMMRMGARLEGVDSIVSKNSFNSLDDLDLDKKVSILSLAYLFGTKISTVPFASGYLCVNRDHSVYGLPRKTGSLNVGLVWSGNTRQKDNSLRSIQPELLAPLGEVPNLNFYSLQKGPPAENIKRVEIPNLVDLSGVLKDFYCTFSVIQDLDLVITVDTAVAHLAGAMGKPVWVMLWTGSCWRYLTNSDQCVWYNSMRLFRQSEFNQWEPVVARIKTELEKFTLSS